MYTWPFAKKKFSSFRRGKRITIIQRIREGKNSNKRGELFEYYFQLVFCVRLKTRVSGCFSWCNFSEHNRSFFNFVFTWYPRYNVLLFRSCLGWLSFHVCCFSFLHSCTYISMWLRFVGWLKGMNKKKSSCVNYKFIWLYGVWVVLKKQSNCLCYNDIKHCSCESWSIFGVPTVYLTILFCHSLGALTNYGPAVT